MSIDYRVQLPKIIILFDSLENVQLIVFKQKLLEHE